MAYTKQTWIDRVGTFLNRFTKSNDTLTSVELVNNPGTITQAGTAFSASRMNYMEAGIEAAHRIATPLSDLSRVIHINGDGVPMFPDNVAGRMYWQDEWATTDGWGVVNGTLSVENGKLVAIATTNTQMYIEKIASMGAGLVGRIGYQSPYNSVNLYGTVDGTQNTELYLDSNYNKNTHTFIDFYSPGTLTKIFIAHSNVSVGDKVVIDSVYIGSGLFDTLVFGKEGRILLSNHGVLSINGTRGKSLLFQKGQYLESNCCLLGTSGAVAFGYDRKTTGINEHIISGYDFTTHSGIDFNITSGNELSFLYGNGTAGETKTLGGITASGRHTYVINFTETTIGPVFKDGIQIIEQTALTGSIKPYYGIARIGCPSWAIGDLLYGKLDNILYRSSPMTQDDVTRYHNGDDAVDSQQKSVTGTPHAIAVYGADGGLKAHGGSVVYDSSNVATGWTTALAAAVEAGGRALLGLVSLGTNWIANLTASAPWDLIIDSNAKLSTWATSGTYEKVLIKKGTWTLASGGVDLTARGTKCVIGEPGSKLVFSSAVNGLYYTSTPTTKDYRMDGVTVEATGTSNTVGFNSCTNMTNCTGTGTGSGAGSGVGFNSCTNMTNCTGTGTGSGAGSGVGFNGCTNMTNCTGTGTGSGFGYGFGSCKKCQQNTATGSTAKYYESYADAGTSYPCADTPNGGFNS